jgi:hypothetical protein
MAALEAIARENAARRQQGFDCFASQGGGMSCYRQNNMSDQTCTTGQQVIRNDGVYSGAGTGRNNPAMQRVRNTGPIPQGEWNATGYQNTLTGSNGVTRNHPNVIRLEPAPATTTYDRDSFRMHGDNATGTASNGCLIVPPATRQTLVDMLRQGGRVRVNVRP